MDNLHARKSHHTHSSDSNQDHRSDFMLGYVDEYVSLLRKKSENLEDQFRKGLKARPFEAVALSVMVGIVIGRLLKP